MKIYLAARYSRYTEMYDYAEELRVIGHVVTSRWIRGEHQITDAQLEDSMHEELRRRFAEEDLQDLMAADLCISFTEEPRANSSRGGRHVEFGVALAMQKLCYVVGHRENVFHCLASVRFFHSWDECLGAIELRSAM